MEFQLRPYQDAALGCILSDWKQCRSVLATLATGSGKTVLFNAVLDRVLKPGQRALILAHRQELIYQPIDKMREFFPHLAERAGIVMNVNDQADADIVVACVPSLQNGRLDAVLEHGPIDYVVIDESHHAISKSYQTIIDRIFEHNPNAKMLGVTATPIRGDGKGLGSIFEKESIHIDLAELVRQGFLAPPRWLGIKVGVRLDNSQKSGTGEARDFTRKHLKEVFETDNMFDLIVATHKKFGGDRQGMVFCVTVDGAHDLAEKFSAEGYPAAAVDGTTPDEDRKQIIDDYLDGKLVMLCNFGVFTEGTDLPPLSVIHMARPTTNDGLYLQCIGRGARLYPGKEDFLVLDYAPANSRNIRMLGDILKVSELQDLNRDAYIDDDVMEGEVIGGFTFDGKVSWMEGDPMEIVGRQLDYLNQSPFKWTQPQKKDWMVLGLGEGVDGNQRILAISPASHEGMALWGITKAKGQYHHRARRLETGDFETLSTRGEQIALKWGAPVLFGKKKPWQAKPPSEKMVKFATKMGVYDPALNAGQISEALNYKLAINALKRAGAIER